MTSCKFRKIADGLCLCYVCGTLAKSDDCSKVNGNCQPDHEDFYCAWRPSAQGHRCVRGGCNRKVVFDKHIDVETLKVRCKGKGPGMAQKAVNFGRAAAEHMAAGSPKRTRKEIKTIVEICVSNICGFYDDKRRVCTHERCGCNVKRKSMWKMQKCPEGYWE